MTDNQPTAESVLFSRQRAAELRRFDRNDLIQASYKVRAGSVHIRAPKPTAEAVAKAIVYLQSKPDTKLGFDAKVVGDVGDEFTRLADDPNGPRTLTGARLVFCAMSLLKLALEKDLISDDDVNAIEVT